MSIIGENHTFAPFTSGKSVAFAGQRLSQITFKTVTDGEGNKTKRDSVCVSIPVLDVSQNEMNAMKGHIVAMVHKAQDGIIREMVLAGHTSVATEQVNFASVLEYLDSESEGTRLTKEDVVAWFDSTNGLADSLRVVFADKLGLSDVPSEGETKRLEQMVTQYRECYASLAGGKKMFEKPIAEKLGKTLEKYCGSEDAIAGRFIGRLNKMVSAEVVDLVDAL